MYVVIMAGGSGTRFWPLSRRRRPKQLLSLFGDRPMVAETVERFVSFVPREQILIVTSEQLAAAIREAVPDLPPENVLCEPFGKNTAPCIGLAAAAVRARGGTADDVIAVFPADHFIRDVDGFQRLVRLAADVASGGPIVTIGIEPTKPETGYGYILRGETRADGSAEVVEFVEKPGRDTALRYVRDGRYLWNAGMFFFRLDTIEREIDRQLPHLSAQMPTLADALLRGDTVALSSAWELVEAVSIDYGVMEKAAAVRVVAATFGWSDVGAWDALPEVADVDESGNVTMGDVVAIDCHGCVLVGHDRRVLAAVGIEGLVVVDSEDALLVAPRDRAQEVRNIVESLRHRDPDLV
jgi:mannose-1-phosphate guanylyltransferase